MLYVHPAAAGHGVGAMLLDALERLARSRGAARLTADVSDSAQDFFRRRGFVPRQRNSVPLAGQWLANTTMDKQLAAKERAQ
jgi:putative acetyltransferase